MKPNYKFRLFATMMIFAIVISFTLISSNYYNLKNEIIENEQRVVHEKIALLHYAINSSEIANLQIGQNIYKQLYDINEELQAYYRNQPNVEAWNYEALSKQYNVDMYIINDQNIISYSNVPSDYGLDFNLCCRSLISRLDELRLERTFYFENFDVEQATGNIKSYSYMSTFDGKYIIQLGYAWKNNATYEQFNFLNIIEQIKLSNEHILAVHVLNRGGLAYGIANYDYQLSQQQKSAFQDTLQTKQELSFDGVWNDKAATFIYSPYISKLDDQTKVIELIYSHDTLQNILGEYRYQFMMSFFIVLTITMILSIMISRSLAKPIYLAFHDNLTSLGNRAYFEDYISTHYLSAKAPFTMFMIDIDHFKQINDTFGHDKGDLVLQQTAMLMTDMINTQGKAFRLGGDEFIILFPHNDQQRAEQAAAELLQAFHDHIANQYDVRPSISLSIGISYSNTLKQDLQSILCSADRALYDAKKHGKNKYCSSISHKEK